MIDLHLHTTASDGRYAPGDLVRRAYDAGLRTISVTDHDTTAGLAEAQAACAARGMTLVPGIEITAVEGERDVHMLGYFVDPSSRVLADFLAGQRADRVRRVVEMGRRLAELGKTVDLADVLQAAARENGKAVGRPHVARALVGAGHVASMNEAFDTLIGEGCPAYVQRRGASPSEVSALIARAGGVAALAHPGLLQQDDLIEPLVAAGLPAIEVYHSEHDDAAREHYGAVARRLGLVATGGSDYHGESIDRPVVLGSVTLPQDEFDRLLKLAERLTSG